MLFFSRLFPLLFGAQIHRRFTLRTTEADACDASRGIKERDAGLGEMCCTLNTDTDCVLSALCSLLPSRVPLKLAEALLAIHDAAEASAEASLVGSGNAQFDTLTHCRTHTVRTDVQQQRVPTEHSGKRNAATLGDKGAAIGGTLPALLSAIAHAGRSRCRVRDTD
jgi:hypothetical protein